MRIHLAANHQGYQLGKEVESWLAQAGHQTIWHGADFLDDGDDYPIFSARVGQAVIADEDAGEHTKGIIFGGDGSGEVITANKVKGVRATFAHSAYQVELARQEADADVLIIGSVHHDLAAAKALIEVFLNTSFGDTLESARRIINTAEYETAGTIEGWLIEG
jgi:ribose 5-phosphate isomerase B